MIGWLYKLHLSVSCEEQLTLDQKDNADFIYKLQLNFHIEKI